MHRENGCPKHHKDCRYNLKTLANRNQKNEVHPLAIKLTEAFTNALMEKMLTTAWCIDLARIALAAELIARAEGKAAMFAENKVRQKIERDKGVRIR